MAATPGKVYLVGAGPGNIGLLTLRGAELLGRAEVVVYDRLAGLELLALAPAGARRIFVGKSPEHHAMEQDEINALLVAEGQAGRRVVRLKGGDPFVFGRGGEEALALHQSGIPFEVVPGITAGVAGPAYAGIPVTHRGVTTSVTLVTGHEDPTKSDSDLDFDALARVGTLVMYMGVAHLSDIAGRLIAAGKPVDTPAAAIQWATTSRQKTVLATLATLADKVAEAHLGAPAIILVGQVAALRNQLAWYESLPLFGRTILVTRTREQASDLVAQLRDLGARVLELPTIAVEPLECAELGAAIDDFEDFQWLVFTSPNGVDQFFTCLHDRGSDARALAGLKVAVIGPGTAKHLAQHGLRADLVPPEAIAESLADALIEAGVGPDTRLLLVRAEEARDVLPDALRQAGALVEDVAVYRSVLPPEVDTEVLAEIIEGRVDLVTLTSSSTARNFVELVRKSAGEEAWTQAQQKLSFASIGPITSETAAELGLNIVVKSPEHTIAGLVAAICRWAAPSAP